MERRIRPTRSGLFAIELAVAVGVFALCAAVCVGIFVKAEVLSRESRELNRAVAAAQNLSELYKAAGGDLAETARRCGGSVEDGALRLGYDALWMETAVSSGPDSAFLLRLEPEGTEGYHSALLTVERLRDGPAELLRWRVAA